MKNSDMLDTITLYDVMYEAGTRLGGSMVALKRLAKSRGDTAEADKWLKEEQKLQSERNSIGPDDRQAMIDAYDKWNAERDRLEKQIELTEDTVRDAA